MSIPRRTTTSPPAAPGLASRRLAADILDGVLRRGRPLDEQLDDCRAAPAFALMPERDRALARRIVATVLRRIGTLRHLLAGFLQRGFPADAPAVETALLIGAAQIVLLDVPAHAAVDLSVRMVQGDRRAKRYAGLVNAVLRQVVRSAPERLAAIDTAALDTPGWLLRRWSDAYGAETARAIARANAQEPALDLSVKADPEGWAARLHGRALPTGTVRTLASGPVTSLAGYAEGAWWVQDAAAALPVRCFGDLRGRTVADLCAAPGGKTLQLACAGARVTAVDRSEPRMGRVRENLRRVGVEAETVVADVLEWRPAPFDAVLLDAPCSSTGTIRRHPDIPLRKTPADIAAMAQLQQRLLAGAVDLVKPGGVLVFSTCSLEPEEGEEVVAAVLARDARVRRDPIRAAEINDLAELLTPAGDLRTLPCHWPDAEPRMAGLDGFYAARLARR